MKILIEIEADGFVQAYQAVNRLRFFGCQILKVETDDAVFEFDESKEEFKVNKLFSENFGKKKKGVTVEIEEKEVEDGI